MNVSLTIESSLDSLDKVAATILDNAQETRIFALTGTLGAGKTTLVKSLLSHYGICSSDVTSPTFTYYNVYKSFDGRTYYHFDLYRIQSMEAFCDMGFHEYIYNRNNIVFIEWPDLIMPLLNENVCHISIDYTSQIDQRILTVSIG
jgi:tRNA threonylcarbamoyladenosine biosynthesis protein TsaE